jgi:SAM-dependent methyltransferase
MLSSNTTFKKYEQPSLTTLPFDAASVDFVTAVCVFHHVHGNDRALLLQEIRRVLTPQGLCCIIEHNPWNPVTQAIVKRCPVDVDAELLTASNTRSLFASSGFESVSTEFFLYLPERLFRTIGTVESLFRKVPLGGQYAVLARVRP